MFPCNRWLDKKEDDGKIGKISIIVYFFYNFFSLERTLEPGNTGTSTYQIKVKTGNVKDAGISLFIIFFFEKIKFKFFHKH